MILRFLIWFAFVFSCLSFCPLQAQELPKNAFSVKALGVSYHLRTSQAPELFPNKLDKEGRAVVNYGAIIGYDRFVVGQDVSLRLQQGLYADCAAALGGFMHIGFRGKILRAGNHSLLGGIGPTLVYRQDWNQLDGYRDDGFFSSNGQWQYRFFWYAGELEYYYTFKENQQLGVTLIPGLPELMLVGFSYRKMY